MTTELTSDDRADLEQQLLGEPFNAALRARYADCLLDAGEDQLALVQAELLSQQRADHADGPSRAARALFALGRRDEALARYAQARRLAGFEPFEPLEREAAEAVPAAGPRLQLVSAPATGATVHAIQQVSEEKLRFSSIVGMDEVKQTVRLKIIEPYLNPSLFARFRARSGGGILLYGPPGCGKTMLARAVANECNAGFVSVGIADVLNMWLGESERNLVAMFDKARQQVPCVLFFDELDALAYARSKASGSSARNVVNEFLTQLDGVGRDNRGVLVLAATNMPWDVDPAMKRPGRFSRQIFVPPPDRAARLEMLRLKLLGLPGDEVDLQRVADLTEHFSGADIDGLIEMATEAALVDALGGRERDLTTADFEAALPRMQASTLDWLRTVRNVVKYAGDDGSYRDVERYLKSVRML